MLLVSQQLLGGFEVATLYLNTFLAYPYFTQAPAAFAAQQFVQQIFAFSLNNIYPLHSVSCPNQTAFCQPM